MCVQQCWLVVGYVRVSAVCGNRISVGSELSHDHTESEHKLT